MGRAEQLIPEPRRRKSDCSDKTEEGAHDGDDDGDDDDDDDEACSMSSSWLPADDRKVCSEFKRKYEFDLKIKKISERIKQIKTFRMWIIFNI